MIRALVIIAAIATVARADTYRFDGEGAEAAGPEGSLESTIHGSLGFVGFVEPVQAALAAHEAKWKTSPTSYDWDVILGGKQ